MGKESSTHEHIFITEEQGVCSYMEKTAHDLIVRIKEIKETHPTITYNRIIEQMAINHQQNEKLQIVSMTTLRRVFSNGSENRASSYNFEETLLPIAEAMDKIVPPSSEVPAYMKEIEGLKSVISVQNEELDRLHDLKDHLEKRVDFLIDQIKLKDVRMDRFIEKDDEKDKIIKEKDAIIQKLMEKVL